MCSVCNLKHEEEISRFVTLYTTLSRRIAGVSPLCSPKVKLCQHKSSSLIMIKRIFSIRKPAVEISFKVVSRIPLPEAEGGILSATKLKIGFGFGKNR